MRFYCISTRIAKIKKSDHTYVLENSLAVSSNFKHTCLPYDPTIPLLSIYPKEKKAHVYTKTGYISVMAALFILDKNWKLSKFSVIGRYINYFHIMEYYSVFKRNTLLIGASTWMNLRHFAK